ncbi:hypothetical protein NQZ68_038065 [Dissostichus eleginoides]|nr:hypothetical protein NQZ68_038065 [Dissostichus eleginoides]
MNPPLFVSFVLVAITERGAGTRQADPGPEGEEVISEVAFSNYTITGSEYFSVFWVEGEPKDTNVIRSLLFSLRPSLCSLGSGPKRGPSGKSQRLELSDRPNHRALALI